MTAQTARKKNAAKKSAAATQYAHESEEPALANALTAVFAN